MEHFDVAVFGLGVFGSAAAYHAARMSKKVIAFEQFELGHVYRASHDTSRIVGTANWEPEYAALARSAYRDWAELEKDTGQKLLTITGVVFLPRNAPTPCGNLIKTLDAENVPYELLNSQEMKRRWPQFNIPDTVDAVYTSDTGIVHASSQLQPCNIRHVSMVQSGRSTPQWAV